MIDITKSLILFIIKLLHPAGREVSGFFVHIIHIKHTFSKLLRIFVLMFYVEHFTMDIYCKITDCKTPSDVSKLIREKLAENNGKTVRIQITESNGDKLNQYGFLYGAVYPILRKALQDLHGGSVSIQDIDLLMKLRFWYIEVPDFETGEIAKIPNTKTRMTKAQMNEYIENVLNFAAEYLNVHIEPKQEADFVIV